MKILRLLWVLVLAPALACADQASTPRAVIWLVEYKVGVDGSPTAIKILMTADPTRDLEVVTAVSKDWVSPKEWAGRRLRQRFHFVDQWTSGVLTVVEFTVDSRGAPKDVRVIKSGEMVAERDVIASVSKWRFPEDYIGQHLQQQFYFGDQPKRPEPNQSLQPTAPSGRG